MTDPTDEFVFDPEEDDECFFLGNNEWAVLDQNHGGEIWITQECHDAFDWDKPLNAIEYDLDDDGKIDEEDWKKEYFDKGLKYIVPVSQVSMVVNEKGVEIREGGLDADVYALNDFTQEMLDHPGAEILSWCDG